MKKTLDNYFYVAPEINTGNAFTRKCDVYSFAAISNELLTCKKSLLQIDEIKGKSNQAFFKLCLSKDPSKRPSFYDICLFMVKKSFMKVFNDNVDIEKVCCFLDLFEEDPKVLFLRGAFIK